MIEEEEIQEILNKFEEAGAVKKVKGGDKPDSYTLTEEGADLAGMMIGLNPDAQLFIFQLMMNDLYSDIKNPHRRMITIANDLKDEPGINIFRTLELHSDKIEGLEVKEDLPEDFLKQFDPE